MDKIMEFLVQYYLYVALGSLAIIIVLILIIVLGNKKRKKKEESEMVNIGDIKTGSVMDVANNMNPANNLSMEPQNIGELTQSIPVVEPTSVFVTESSEPTSVSEAPINTEISQPIVPEEPINKPIEAIPVTSIQEEVGSPVIGETVQQQAPIPEPVVEIPIEIPVIKQRLQFLFNQR
jgi:hypothetical protein